MAATAIRRARRLAAPLVLSLSLVLAACGEDGAGSAVVVPAPLPSTTATPMPTATATSTAFNVDRCFNQTIPGQNGATLASLIVPDTLKLDLNRPSRFPNGSDLDDEVIDILLSLFLLDQNVTGQGPNTLASVPVNPPRNDKLFSLTFPFLAPAQGAGPRATARGTRFDFRTDPDSAYVTVERAGQPAISTVLVSGPLKIQFNEDTPAGDAVNQKYLAEFRKELTALHRLVGDDLEGLQLRLCSDKS